MPYTPGFVKSSLPPAEAGIKKDHKATPTPDVKPAEADSFPVFDKLYTDIESAASLYLNALKKTVKKDVYENPAKYLIGHPVADSKNYASDVLAAKKCAIAKDLSDAAKRSKIANTTSTMDRAARLDEVKEMLTLSFSAGDKTSRKEIILSQETFMNHPGKTMVQSIESAIATAEKTLSTALKVAPKGVSGPKS